MLPSVIICWARRVGKWLPQVQVSWKSDRRWAMKLVDHLLEQGFMSSRNSSSWLCWQLGHVTEGERTAWAAGMPTTPRACLGTHGEALKMPRAGFVTFRVWVPPQGPKKQSSPWSSSEMGI